MDLLVVKSFATGLLKVELFLQAGQCELAGSGGHAFALEFGAACDLLPVES